MRAASKRNKKKAKKLERETTPHRRTVPRVLHEAKRELKEEEEKRGHSRFNCYSMWVHHESCTIPIAKKKRRIGVKTLRKKKHEKGTLGNTTPVRSERSQEGQEM